MITRWRIESEADNAEDVEDHMESATQAFLGHLRDVQPEDEWECTDEYGPKPALDDEFRAIVVMRRVFKRMSDR